MPRALSPYQVEGQMALLVERYRVMTAGLPFVCLRTSRRIGACMLSFNQELTDHAVLLCLSDFKCLEQRLARVVGRH